MTVSCTPNHRDTVIMKTRILTALAIAIAASTVHAAAPWTSFKIGKLTSYTLNFTVRPDGRFLYGATHEVYSQNTFGAAAMTKVNRGSLVIDPSFIAVKDLTTALLGEGGFSSSGVHVFNPATPTVAVSGATLGTLQNYAAVWWHHPTSGREGWIIGGANSGGKHNLTFLSADGTHTGALTDILCTYSAGIATDTAGNVFAALSGDADAETVIEFTTTQLDSAVAAVIAGTPAPLAKSSASTVHQFGGAASIAVDKLGRIWAASYLTSDLEVFDPTGGKTWHVTPSHSALAGAGGSPTYQVQTFVRNGGPSVAFIANDSAFTMDSDVIYGSAAAENLISIDAASQTVAESAGTLSIGVSISPAPTKTITIPVITSGTATKGSDYTLLTPSVVFHAGETTSTISVKIIDDLIDEPINNETLVLTLGTPTVGALVTDANKHTITITDNDLRPLFETVQNLSLGRVGSAYSYQVAMVSVLAGLPVTFRATGLPKGFSIDKNTGLITGQSTVPGEYDQIVVTATNSAGTSVSKGLVLTIEDYSATAHGNFVGIVGRKGEIPLGARIDLSTTSTGTFSGKVVIGRNSYAVSGTLDTRGVSPEGTCIVKTRPTNIPILHFAIDPVTGALSGYLANVSISGWRCVSATSLTGAHNFSLTPTVSIAGAPEGTGFGTATVVANGTTSIIGKAADGSSFTSSACLGLNGELPILQVLYSVPGSLFGSIAIANDAAHTVSGSLDWSKPAQSNFSQYAFGWQSPFNLSVTGGRYRPVSGSTSALGLTEDTGYGARFAFKGAGLILYPPLPLTILPPLQTASFSSFNGVKPIETLKISNSTGALSGQFGIYYHPAVPVVFSGLLVPDPTTTDPFDTNGVGYFMLEPNTSKPNNTGPGAISGAIELTRAP